MGIRHSDKGSLNHLESKPLDAKFLHEIPHGLRCSPFEAEVVLSIAREN
ncbi:MAG: hypothetical protein K9M57_01095 [Phycisphaerae bacterium]|nr:hypothetical protein [Phycisphaerae bacterium]